MAAQRLIDLDEAMEATRKEIYWTESRAADVRSFLILQPRVDAVPVVRCKDCKWFWKYKINNNYCCCRHSRNGHHQVFDVKFTENDFCSYGERRTDNG